jgi:hypothetical protein
MGADTIYFLDTTPSGRACSAVARRVPIETADGVFQVRVVRRQGCIG